MSSVVDCPDRHSHRVTTVCGDLTEPGLGLDPGAEREWIAEHVSEIIHCAASVSFDMSLTESRSINVEGTRRVLELAHECAGAGNGLRRLTYRVDGLCGGRPAWAGAGELLEPLGLRATPITGCFDTLIDFAEAADWGRAPISRVQTLRPTRPAAQVVRTAEAVA